MSSAEPTATLARTILAAHEHRRQMAPPSTWDPGFDLPASYRVAAQVRRLREARGERPVGRKIGFTNTTIWAEYGVDGPILGTIYDTTLFEAAALDGSLPLSAFVEPRIEPEIVFGLARAPEPGMDRHALFDCIAWIGLGFEIVQSLYAGWRFTAADTVAAFGLHGALVMGPRITVGPGEAQAWLAGLERFEASLSCDGAVVDRGRATNVLGAGPLAALEHLAIAIAQAEDEPPLTAGEIISTGTLTRALPIHSGQTWRAAVSGLPLPDIDLALG